MPQTVNDRLFSEAVHHAVDLHSYSNWVVRRLLGQINKTDARLFAQLQIALAELDAGSFTVERLDGLLISIRAINAEVYAQFLAGLTSDLAAFAGAEAAYHAGLFGAVLPAQISFTTIGQEQVYAAAMARPFQGRLLKEWASGIEADRMTRIRDSLRSGYLEGKTVAQMVTEIRGTRAKGYSDGIIEIDRRHAETITRTAVSHMASAAREQFTAANLDIIKAVVWRATLDNKTSEPCRLRDGKEYTPGTHKPIGHSLPWGSGPGRYHFNCRSLAVPVTKSWEELGGAGGPELSPKQRASMDGAVPAETTYSDWLARQSASRQDEILGATRGKLLRSGGLTVDRFATDKGRWLTLEELRQRNEGAFKRAGL
ncbi:MAG TPA: phage minor head protein [Burkholderiaceae bacterium]|nr:phage minor head protein [Burkholderiaceae bacterium]